MFNFSDQHKSYRLLGPLQAYGNQVSQHNILVLWAADAVTRETSKRQMCLVPQVSYRHLQQEHAETNYELHTYYVDFKNLRNTAVEAWMCRASR